MVRCSDLHDFILVMYIEEVTINLYKAIKHNLIKIAKKQVTITYILIGKGGKFLYFLQIKTFLLIVSCPAIAAKSMYELAGRYYVYII